MRLLLYTIAVFALCVVFTWVAIDARDRRRYDARIRAIDMRAKAISALPEVTGSDVVIVGDSVVDLFEWHELVEVPGGRLISRGVSGATTGDILRFKDILLKGKPRAIVLFVGLNDYLSGTCLDVFESNYSDLLAYIPKDVSVYIYELPYLRSIEAQDMDRFCAYNEAMSRVARCSGESRIIVPAEIGEKAHLNDGVHLSRNGYMLAARSIEKIIHSMNPRK